jgi:hypothetical protein
LLLSLYALTLVFVLADRLLLAPEAPLARGRVLAMGSVPVVTWEPWLTDFENVRHGSLPLRDARDKHGLAAVACGECDFYVDWMATAALNFGSVAYWPQWWTFRELFGVKYPVLAGFGKPVMIAEFGSLSTGGDRLAWYREALTGLPQQYPAVKASLFFNTPTTRRSPIKRWTGRLLVIPS